MCRNGVQKTLNSIINSLVRLIEVNQCTNVLSVIENLLNNHFKSTENIAKNRLKEKLRNKMNPYKKVKLKIIHHRCRRKNYHLQQDKLVLQRKILKLLLFFDKKRARNSKTK